MELLDDKPKLAKNVLNRDYGFSDDFLTPVLIRKCIEILVKDNLSDLKSIILKRGNLNKTIIEYMVDEHFQIFNSFNIKDLITISLKHENERIINLTYHLVKNIKSDKLGKINKRDFSNFLKLLNQNQIEELNTVITLSRIS